jgi:DNA-directed RNA polymerase subunit F
VLPSNVGQLKLILQGYSITVTQENMKRIVDIIQPYKKK